MTGPAANGDRLDRIDAPTRALVRLAARVAAGGEQQVRNAIEEVVPSVPATWVEELLLQSYLFAGFPRALNAMREWRRIASVAAPTRDADAEGETTSAWELRGEVTCARVYGEMYDQLRRNIRALHPALDRWMIVDGYGMVLGREGLDLQRRELCIVAACVASGQDRQLLSHLHGSLNVGVTRGAVDEALDALEEVVSSDSLRSARLLLERVAKQKQVPDVH